MPAQHCSFFSPASVEYRLSPIFGSPLIRISSYLTEANRTVFHMEFKTKKQKNLLVSILTLKKSEEKRIPPKIYNIYTD